MNIYEYLKKAVEKLRSFPESTRVRVVSHYDTDGICSAAILARSLEREGFDFHISLLNHPFRDELRRLKDENNELIIFSDLGSGQIDLIREIGVDAIILDHHQPLDKRPILDSIVQINSNIFNIDGNFEISGAGLCYMFSKELNRNNTDLSVFALTGATGDKQHLGGFKGINMEILNEGRENDLIILGKPSIKVGDGNLLDEITNSIDPFYPRLSGREDEVDKLLKKMSIHKDAKYSDLNKDEKKSLHSFLLLGLLENDVDTEILDDIIRERLVSEMFPTNIDVVSEIIDSCSKGGDTGLSLSFCLNPQKYFDIVKDKGKAYKKRILDKLVDLENEGLKEERNMVYFLSDKASEGSYMSGIVSNYFKCKKKSVFSFTVKEDKIHVSCRTSRRSVEKGLDLGDVMKETAKKFGGSGGGHRIAAGGSIENTNLEELVKFIDDLLERYNESKM